MANYTKTNIGNEGRAELHETLSLTGAEISINQLPEGANVPFIHSHKNNEEIYGILSGKGKAIIDNEEIGLSCGDWLKVSPAAKRQFFAADDSGITYVCIHYCSIKIKYHKLNVHTPVLLFLSRQVLYPAVFPKMIHNPWYLTHFIQTRTCIYNNNRPV